MKTPFTVGRHVLLGTPVILDASGRTLAVMSQPDKEAATLLAAAPELLNALSKAVRLYHVQRDIFWKSQGLPRPSDDTNEPIREFEAVILKAIGPQ